MATICHSFYFTIIYFLSLLTINSTNGATANLNAFRNFPNHLNISKEYQKQWLLKTAVPSYFKEFMDLYLQNSTSGELLQSNWFTGVNPDCELHIKDWLARLKKDHWNEITSDEYKWVLQMVDAWGKIPEGILSGHVHSYGDYDQCVQIDANVNELVVPGESSGYSYNGMYCSVYILPLDPSELTSLNAKANQIRQAIARNGIQEAVSFEKLLEMMFGGQSGILPLLPTIGTCFPNTCTQNDILMLLINMMTDIYSKLPKNLPLYPIPVSCTDKHKPDMDAATICVIILLSILAGLALVAGIVDYWQRRYKPDSTLPKQQAYKYLMAFSIYTNTKKLLGTHRSSEDLSCLHGIRFFSTAWVVLGHTYATFMQGPQWNMIDMTWVYNKWPKMLIINGTFSVDTFFVMSGMLATYGILKMLDKSKGKFNIVMFYVHRYIRLTPCYAILIGINATLLKYAAYGPQGFLLESSETFCKKNWWTNLLYINNLVNTAEMCNGESWYLANDMQFFILSPFIVYPMWKWEKMGTLLLTIYTALSCIAPVLVTRYATGALPAAAMTRPEFLGTGFVEIYQRPWSRISTFLVGIWLGWILHKTRGRQINIKRPIVLLLWILNTAMVLAVILGVKPWFNPANDISEVAGYFYAGLSRFSFAVGVGWVIFACLKGYGGIINEFLSWSAFMPLGRLCFCVYLTSIHLQGIFHSRLTVPIKFESYTLVNIYFAHMVMSYFVGFLCTLLFESPFIIVQKLMFERVTANPKEHQQSNGNALKATEKETINNNKNELTGVKVSDLTIQ